MNLEKTECPAGLRIAAAIPFLLILIVFTGCSQRYGKINSSPEITQNLKSNPVLADHRYYYRGRASDPYAIVGIHQNYTLDSSLWQETDLTASELRQLIEQMSSGESYAPFGSEIVDSSGNYVGIWFSNQYWATVKMENDNWTVAIIPDTPYFIRE